MKKHVTALLALAIALILSACNVGNGSKPESVISSTSPISEESGELLDINSIPNNSTISGKDAVKWLSAYSDKYAAAGLCGQTWTDANTIPADNLMFFYYFHEFDNRMAELMEENPEKYPAENMPAYLNIEQEEVEKYIQRFFNVDALHLRTSEEYYNAGEKAYKFSTSTGFGYRGFDSAEVRRENNVLYFFLNQEEDNGAIRTYKLTVQIIDATHFKFIAGDASEYKL